MADTEKDQAAKQLQDLIARAQKALEKRDQGALEQALDDLSDFRDTDFDDLRVIAKRAHSAISNENMSQAILALASALESLKGVREELQQATDVAAAGQANLLFPKAAQKASAALDKVTKLKQDFLELKTAVTEEAAKAGKALDSVHELKDIPDALDKLVAALQSLQSRNAK